MDERNYNELYSLKAYRVRIANQTMVVRYDPEKKMIYPLDENGNPTGLQAHVDLSGYILEEVTFEPVPLETPEMVSTEKTQETQGGSQEPEGALNLDGLWQEIPCEGTQTPAGDDPAEVGTGSDEAERPLETQEPQGGQERKLKRGKLLGLPSWLLVLGAVVAAVFLWLAILSGTGKGSVTETDPTDTTGQLTASEQTEADPTEHSEFLEPMVSVLTVSTDLLPGHVIGEDDLVEVSLPESQYHSLCAAGGIYTAAYLERIYGMSIVEYISAGQYLNYDNIADAYEPVNPWGGKGSSTTIISLPIAVDLEQLNSYLWGNSVNIIIRVQSVVSTPAPGNAQTNPDDPNATTAPSEPSTPSGMQHQASTVESTVIDTYTVNGVTIVNVLNANKESLYPRYYSLASIPSVFLYDIISSQYEDPDVMDADIPCYLRVAVTADQAKLINSLNRESMKVSISNVGISATNDLQSAVYSDLQAVARMIVKVLSEKTEVSE